jgi:hypothetical protein
MELYPDENVEIKKKIKVLFFATVVKLIKKE